MEDIRLKYSTTSFPPDDHIVIDSDDKDALTIFFENGGLCIVRWYNCLDLAGNITGNWRVDPSSGISLTKDEVPKLIEIIAKEYL